jgi:hypothetical protein
MKLKPDGVGGGAAGQACPLDRALAILDPLLAGPRLLSKAMTFYAGLAISVMMKPTRG